MSYLDVQQTLELLNKELPPNQVRYGLTQLADLCRREHLTPLFYYDKCLDLLERGYDPEHDDQPIKPSTFSGYLSADRLQSLVNKPTSQPVKQYSAIVYETITADYVELTKGDRVALCSTAHDGNPQNTISTYDLKESDAATVTHDDLVFPTEQVQDYIKLVKCEELKRQLKAQARNDDELSDNTAKSYEITIGLLLDLLLNKSKGFDKDGKDLGALYKTITAITTDIADQKIYGQGKTVIGERFTDAQRKLADIRK